MKRCFDIRFCAALVLTLVLGVSCSSSSAKDEQIQLRQGPKVEATVQQESAPAAVVEPPSRPKPARKPQVARTVPAAAKAPSEPPVDFIPPAIIEPEQPIASVEPKPVHSEGPAQSVERRITVPSGTLIPVRMVDAISSDEDHAGQTFRASLDSDVTVRGETVIPRRANAFVKLVEVKSAGELTGKSELKVQLESIVVDGKRYTVDSNVFFRESASQTTQTAKSAGIGAGIGAIVGAIAGGKKGAAIGAGVGAGSGVAIEAASKSEQARIESEARVDFRLEAPLDITVREDAAID